MLKTTFLELISVYTDDKTLAERLWLEIETAYTDPKRHYHSLFHLENLFVQLNEIKPLFPDWNATLFSLFYHDVVYNVLQNDNEEKSAQLAEKRMRELDVPTKTIAKSLAQILATKTHVKAEDIDINFFTDADLSILGQAPERYNEYTKQVREEYSIYPDILYKPGRKKVLAHFLQMERIYKTERFYNLYETQAKRNLSEELTKLL